MKVIDNVTALRPSNDIVAMLRQLADELEGDNEVSNVFVVLERDDDETDVRCFGPCDCPYRAAGVLSKAVRDLLP